MKQILTYFFSLIVLLSCGTTEHYKSLWHKTSQNEPATVFQAQNALTLKVSNDETRLFIEITSNNETTIAKIKNLGLSLWLSAGSAPRKSFGIHYPLPYTDCENKVALEGFSTANLVPIPLNELSTMQISATFANEEMHYNLQIPLEELQLSNEDIFTIQIASFEAGKEEYLSSLTSQEEIERRLDKYKVHPEYQHNKYELIPFFNIFELAKMPSKNP